MHHGRRPLDDVLLSERRVGARRLSNRRHFSTSLYGRRRRRRVTLKCDGCNEERRLGCIDQLAGALGMDRSYVRECMETFKFTCYDAALTCSTDQPKVLNTLHPYGIFQFAAHCQTIVKPANPPIEQLLPPRGTRRSARLKRKRVEELA